MTADVRLILVRHGQSANNASYAAAAQAAGTDVGQQYERVPDPPLTGLGARQAEALAAALRAGGTGFTPTHLYASLPVRAVQTVAPLAAAVDLPVVLRGDAYEVGGVHVFDRTTGERSPRPGATFRELAAVCPQAVPGPGVPADPDEPWAGGFETVDDAPARAKGLVGDLRATHGPGDVVVLVAHQYFAQFVLAELLGLDGPPWMRFRVDNTGHVSVALDGEHPFVEWVNRCDHLDPADVTN